MAIINVGAPEVPVQEFGYAGKVYKMKWDDDSRVVIYRKFKEVSTIAQKAKSVSPEKLSEEELDALEAEAIRGVRDFFDACFGEGSFNDIYEDSYRTMPNVMKFVLAIGNFVTEKFAEQKTDARKKYVKK